MKTTIIAQPLTKAAFAPFGSVIEPYDDEEKCPENSWDINRGYACRHDAISKVQNDGGEVGFSIFRTKRRDCPITLSVMEYHPFGSQAFFSMNSTDYLVVVAKAGEPPKSAADLEVFYAYSHQGVQYDANVWHHPLLALNADCDFLVVDRINGDGNNCHEFEIDDWEVCIDVSAEQAKSERAKANAV